uniref:Peptidase S1 domain-containing protein n=1 Tax=Anopheles epiroticus TaxID=199890 RepID=A0A182PPE7_9DIPT
MFALLFLALLAAVHADSPPADGADGSIYNFQFVVAITYAGEMFRNGVIVTKRWILTSAIPAEPYTFADYSVVVGAEDFYNEGTWHAVQGVYKHPHYIGVDYNLALVLIRGSIEYTARVQPIHLPTSDLASLEARMVSFDHSKENGRPHLREAYCLLTSDDSCISHQADELAKRDISDGLGYCVLPGSDLAVGHYNASGAPIVADRVIYAVFVEPIEGRHGVAVATRIWRFKDWIQTTTGV